MPKIKIPEGVSPEIAAGLRRSAMDREHERILREALDEQGILSARSERKRRRHRERVDARCAQKRMTRLSDAPPIDRQAIIARDGSKCYLCDRQVQASELHLDHVVPLSRGGAHTAENLRVSCARCNLAKGNLTKEEYQAKIAGYVVRRRR